MNLPELTGKAKYIKIPIVNKYRKGKVKRTLKKGVKRPRNRATTSGWSLDFGQDDSVPFA